MPTVAVGRPSRVLNRGEIRASARSSRGGTAPNVDPESLRRQVLQAVDRDVDQLVQKGPLDLLGKKAEPAELREACYGRGLPVS